MKNAFLFIIPIIACFGCTPSVLIDYENRTQILEVQSSNIVGGGRMLQYHNDTIQIAYFFWSDGGIMDLIIHNRSNRPLYIDWKKCSFITGSTKNDYWDENVLIKENGTSDGASTRLFGILLNNSSFSSITSLTKQERITFLPPGTTIERNYFRITESLVKLDDPLTTDTLLLLKQSHWLTGNDYYDKSTLVRILIKKYEEDTSPLKFRSFITYSLDEKFSTEAYVNSSFYISCIIQIPQWAFDAKKIADDKERETRNIWVTPSSFYRTRK
jgi:hypothetical protein